jgi:Helicase associated domain
MKPHSWDERFAEYKQKKENGVTLRSTIRNWVSEQRKMYSNGTIPREWKEKLDGIGFVWNPSYQHRTSDCEAWSNNFELLKKHHGEKGTCQGPYQDKLFKFWVYNQRTALKNKERLDKVQLERWTRLNTLGFWGANEQQHESSGSDESGLDSTAHVSHSTVSDNSASDGEIGQGQQRSGIVQITVSVME